MYMLETERFITNSHDSIQHCTSLEELDTFLAFGTEYLRLAALNQDIQCLEHGIVVHSVEF
jgi:hypothetical protein